MHHKAAEQHLPEGRATIMKFVMIFYILFMLFEHLIHHEFSLISIFAAAICRILSGEYVVCYILALLI